MWVPIVQITPLTATVILQDAEDEEEEEVQVMQQDHWLMDMFNNHADHQSSPNCLFVHCFSLLNHDMLYTGASGN